MLSHYKRLFTYDTWANQRVINSMKQLSTEDERCLHLFSHIFAAQEIWLGRITGSLSAIQPFPARDFQQCVDEFQAMTKNWNQYLLSISDSELERIVSYTNIKGDKFNTAVNDILTHVINHSTYHRAQIVATLKGKIEKLPVTDFIVFARE